MKARGPRTRTDALSSANMKYAAPAGAAGAPYSLSACAGDVRRHNVFAVHDHGERLAVVGLLEGRLAANQHVEDDAQTPNVCRETSTAFE